MGASQFTVVKQQMELLLCYLEPLLPFTKCHMVDYFTKSLFSRYIPDTIQQELLQIGHKESFSLILNNAIDSRTSELKLFLDNMKNLTLYNCTNICLSTEQLFEKFQEMGCTDMCTFKLKAFMTTKKAHEVEVLSTVAAALKHIGKTTHVVDIGDGKGYLSSMLALYHEIPVLGIDSSEINTYGAEERAKKMQKKWHSITNSCTNHVISKKDIKIYNSLLYKQVTQFVKADLNVKQLISDTFLTNTMRLSLTGLHTCGDLSSTSIKIFNSNEYVKTLCNVGCCYHLLTEQFDDQNVTDTGFPLSNFLISRKFTLGRNSRMLAAQSLDRIIMKKETFNKIILYRAIVEVLLKKYNYSSTKTVGKIKKPCNNFLEYVNIALKKLNVEITITEEEINELYSVYQYKEDELNLFNLFRCLVAPVIESLILLDRLLFLLEQGHDRSYLVQLFNPVISPRCYGLISLKSN